MRMNQGNGVITDFTGGIRSGFFSSMEGSDAPGPRVEGTRVQSRPGVHPGDRLERKVPRMPGWIRVRTG